MINVTNVDEILSGKYHRPLYEKFIEAYEVDDFEVYTKNGWVNIEGVGKTIPFIEYYIKTTSKELTCADNHILYLCSNIDFDNKKCDINEVYTKDLKIGDFIMTKDGVDMIIEIEIKNSSINMYDLQLSDGSNKQYFTNGILSHNSLWMQNLTFLSADLGYNVLYVTLEMSEAKVMKRLGSMRLKIPVNDYDVVSRDIDFMQKKLSNLNRISGSELFEKNVGKIFTKFFPAGTATTHDIDNYISKLRQRRGIEINLIVVDYVTLLVTPKGSIDSLYTKGKTLAEGLRALGHKYNCPVITAVQVAKGAWNSTDISLEDIPESKAIAETADTFFAIIRTEEMKKNDKYILKLLKQRDGDFSRSKVMFDLNRLYLTVENGNYIE